MLSMIWAMLVVAAPEAAVQGKASAQASNPRSVANQLVPSTKRCSDGSIVLAADRCPLVIDHRYQFTHEPARQVRIGRWWCTGSAEPSQFQITLQIIQPARRADPPTQVNRLEELLVNGRPGSATLKRSIQQRLDSFHRFDTAAGRCLAIRSGGTVPVLTLHGSTMVEGKLGSKHEEIRLR